MLSRMALTFIKHFLRTSLSYTLPKLIHATNMWGRYYFPIKCLGKEAPRGLITCLRPKLMSCYGLNVYVPPNSYVEALTPSVMVSGVRALGGDEVLGWSHRDGWVPLYRRPWRAPTLFLQWDTVRKYHLWTRKWVLTKYWIWWCLGFRISSLQNCEK